MSAQLLPRTVLLVEDDPQDVRLITRALRPEVSNLQVPAVSSGEEAIAYLEGQGPFANRRLFPVPSVVLLDIGLPGMDGLAVLRWIRQHPRYAGLVVVMLTGSESTEQMRAAYDLHVNSFLKKNPLLGMGQVSQGVLSYWVKLNQTPSRPE